ncbi:MULTISPECIES: xanthine dehydrogenase family protein molybdopterin-binding subunit [unclassified Massilia]|uniref:xanthine dehydrogenase family protein molybdopterin-binding subunit n=1 Tax=unclassified Massilia TaxID=2609279 RepID=UPI001780C385|nr:MULTISPECIES: xanthine dehydrogenase family protein molybdopterin-binding subunit [unclassified Massilia]MBD8533426.1 xanthine dehydrogenase family protein molybdopterin-binding subunit [Massilia sp. CFBP 13647]MBD8676819.1 xanthine dehydrogenase family protein molybdopterin-binding subunit [Massilia sp. CFBP 13721]
MSVVGQGIDRVDGRLKVTGAATYSAEHKLQGLAHAVMVLSTIPKGRVEAIDITAANAMPGVLAVMTHANAPRLALPQGSEKKKEGGEQSKPDQKKQPPNPKLSLLQDDVVWYNAQPVAVVIADTFEHARDAAQRLQVRYRRERAQLDFAQAKKSLRRPEPQPERPSDTGRGNLARSMERAASRIDVTYTTPMENHNPIEPHATIAHWQGDNLILYDSTQNVTGVQRTAASTFGIAPQQVRVICPFVGGGFGCKGSVWSHVVLAAMAAKLAGRPVKLVLDRPQMYGPVGARPLTEQRLALGASRAGKLAAVRHDTISSTAFLDDFAEPCTAMTRKMYASDSLQTSQRLATLNVGVPTYMRAPGESSGSFALESAMDELAYKLNMDPVQLRLANYADKDPEKDLPWSSKSLRECYRIAAERFGWDKRNPQPRSMKSGRTLVGWGMATATYPANRKDARATATLLPDGSAVVRSGSHDLGTGTYTVMSQIAADALGMPVANIRFQLGDTALPEAPVSGGSQTVASVGPAVHQAARALRDKLIGMALADGASPLHGLRADEVDAADGWLVARSAPARRERMQALLARAGGQPVSADAHAEPGEEKKRYAMHAFGAVFVEVHIDPDVGTIRIPRIVGAYGVGRVMNRKTAHSQLMGGIVWGMGMGLMEKTEMDWRFGRAVNANLADYHVPVNADIGAIDIVMVDEEDKQINELGAKGVGEIGITGVAAAIANAVYHATGKRIRDLPITPDKVLV